MRYGNEAGDHDGDKAGGCSGYSTKYSRLLFHCFDQAMETGERVARHFGQADFIGFTLIPEAVSQVDKILGFRQ